jgi:hypothetical protein
MRKFIPHGYVLLDTAFLFFLTKFHEGKECQGLKLGRHLLTEEAKTSISERLYRGSYRLSRADFLQSDFYCGEIVGVSCVFEPTDGISTPAYRQFYQSSDTILPDVYFRTWAKSFTNFTSY